MGVLLLVSSSLSVCAFRESLQNGPRMSIAGTSSAMTSTLGDLDSMPLHIIDMVLDDFTGIPATRETFETKQRRHSAHGDTVEARWPLQRGKQCAAITERFLLIESRSPDAVYCTFVTPARPRGTTARARVPTAVNRRPPGRPGLRRSCCRQPRDNATRLRYCDREARYSTHWTPQRGKACVTDRRFAV